MIHELTAKANTVFSLAEEIAKPSDSVTSAHFLLALVKEGTGHAAQALRNRKLTFLTMMERLCTIDDNETTNLEAGKLSYTPAAKQIIDRCVKCARFKQTPVATEDILASIAEQQNTLAAELLDSLGYDTIEMAAYAKTLADEAREKLNNWCKWADQQEFDTQDSGTDNTRPLVRQLLHSQADERQKITQSLMNVKTDSMSQDLGRAISVALLDEIVNDRAWKTQQHLIVALGNSGYREALSLLRDLRLQDFESTALYATIDDACRQLSGLR